MSIHAEISQAGTQTCKISMVFVVFEKKLRALAQSVFVILVPALSLMVCILGVLPYGMPWQHCCRGKPLASVHLTLTCVQYA